MTLEKIALQIGCFYGATAVAFGALGAHFLKNKIEDFQLENYKTAVYYQLFHAILLVALALNSTKIAGTLHNSAVYLLIAGVFLFSGSIYILSLKGLLNLTSVKWLGPITPIGGLCLIIAWLLLMVQAFKS